MNTKNNTQKPAARAAATGEKSEGFTAEEKTAMKERARELKAEARVGKDKAYGENLVLAKMFMQMNRRNRDE